MRETLGDRHTNTLTAINNLGSLLKEAGDFAAAEPLLRTAVEVQRETLGERHPYTLFSTNTLGQLLHAKGDFTAAERLLRDALKLQRETLGDRHPDTLTSANSLGQMLYAKGDAANRCRHSPTEVLEHPANRSTLKHIAGSYRTRTPSCVVSYECRVYLSSLNTLSCVEEPLAHHSSGAPLCSLRLPLCACTCSCTSSAESFFVPPLRSYHPTGCNIEA